MKILRSILVATALASTALGASAHGFKAGDIDIGHPYARVTLPGQPTGGAYMSFDNHGAPDRLVSVQTAAAKSVELHSSALEGNVMRMRQLDAIDLPTNQAVVLQPGGLHLMLIGLKAPLKQGDSFPMTLKFEKAGDVVVEVKVQATPPAAPASQPHH